MSFLLNVARRGAGLAPVAGTTSNAVAPAQAPVPLTAADELGDGAFAELDAEPVVPLPSASAGALSVPVTPRNAGEPPDASTTSDVAPAGNVTVPSRIEVANASPPGAAGERAIVSALAVSIATADDGRRHSGIQLAPGIAQASHTPWSPHDADGVREERRSFDREVIRVTERTDVSPAQVMTAVSAPTAWPEVQPIVATAPESVVPTAHDLSDTKSRAVDVRLPHRSDTHTTGETVLPRVTAMPTPQRRARSAPDDVPQHRYPPPFPQRSAATARHENAPEVTPAPTVDVAGSIGAGAVAAVQTLRQRAEPLVARTQPVEDAKASPVAVSSAAPLGAAFVTPPGAAFVAPPAEVVAPATEPRVPLFSVPRAVPATRAMPPPRNEAAAVPRTQREVQVHIGAIEVRATPPLKPAEAPPPAVRRAAEAGEHGFDAFAQLRSYAGWGR
jgi:hypothetical protein